MFSPVLVHDYLKLSAQKYPNKDALIFKDRRLTYEELFSESISLAKKLMDLNLKHQDRVVVFMDNSIETIISLYGILNAGAIFIIMNGQIKSRKLNYILKDSGATFLITHTNKMKVIEPALTDLNQKLSIIWVGNENSLSKTNKTRSCFWNELIIGNHQEEREHLEIKSKPTIDFDLASFIYTSGSTGEPKGVMSSHFNMVSSARSIIQYLENKPEEIILNVLPLSFDYGLYQVIMSVMVGGTIVLEPNFIFPVRILELIEKERITAFPIVPTILCMMLHLSNIKKYDLNSLRYISNTGAALPEEHIRKFRSLLPNVNIYSMYGLTECKRVAYLSPEEIDKKPGSVGKAMPNCRVMILDHNGNQVKQGDVGELVIRGANVMRGYWNAPDLTAQTFRQDSRFPGETLLYSGDHFRQDEDGFLYFVGRRDEMIKTKGERVSPKEIENVLCSLNGILEAAVVGMPDSILGQVIRAYVVVDHPNKLSKKEIQKYCADNIEIFMVPKFIEYVDELPKTPNGKIDKKLLKNSDDNFPKSKIRAA